MLIRRAGITSLDLRHGFVQPGQGGLRAVLGQFQPGQGQAGVGRLELVLDVLRIPGQHLPDKFITLVNEGSGFGHPVHPDQMQTQGAFGGGQAGTPFEIFRITLNEPGDDIQIGPVGSEGGLVLSQIPLHRGDQVQGDGQQFLVVGVGRIFGDQFLQDGFSFLQNHQCPLAIPDFIPHAPGPAQGVGEVALQGGVFGLVGRQFPLDGDGGLDIFQGRCVVPAFFGQGGQVRVTVGGFHAPVGIARLQLLQLPGHVQVGDKTGFRLVQISLAEQNAADPEMHGAQSGQPFGVGRIPFDQFFRRDQGFVEGLPGRMHVALGHADVPDLGHGLGQLEIFLVTQVFVPARGVVLQGLATHVIQHVQPAHGFQLVAQVAEHEAHQVFGLSPVLFRYHSFGAQIGGVLESRQQDRDEDRRGDKTLVSPPGFSPDPFQPFLGGLRGGAARRRPGLEPFHQGRQVRIDSLGGESLGLPHQVQHGVHVFGRLIGVHPGEQPLQQEPE